MLQDTLNQLTERWQQLSARDQLALKWLAGLLVVAILVFGLISPLHRLLVGHKANLTAAQQTYQELTRLAPLAMANNANIAVSATPDLNSEVRKQAAVNGFDIQRFEPDGNNLKVWLEEAAFSAVVAWLASLEERGIAHTDLVVDQGAKSGYVDVRVTLLP